MHYLNQLNSLPSIPSHEKYAPKQGARTPTKEEKAKDDIKGINAFYKEHGREPYFDRTNYIEYGLCEKLQRLRFKSETLPFLKELDTYNLLRIKPDHATCKSPQGRRAK